jgi:hypothetical protein
MAMTPEQKAANREARRERDRAWRARYKARGEVEARGLAEIEQQFGPSIEAADRKAEEALRVRNEAISVKRREVARLEQELKDFAESSGHELEEVRKPLHDLCDLKRSAVKLLETDLDRQFPDLVGSARWSAAAWSSPRRPLPWPK